MPDKNIPEKIKSPLAEEQYDKNNEEISAIEPGFDTQKITTEQPTEVSETISEAPPTPSESQVEIETPKERELITTEDESLEGRINSLKKKLRLKKKKSITIPQVKDELTERIEQVMQEGLEDAYMELTPIQQQEFKIKGEEVAWKIRQLMKKTHVKIKEVFKLLMEWLKMLPGINSFFLEQEAKIKADKIVSIKENQQE